MKNLRYFIKFSFVLIILFNANCNKSYENLLYKDQLLKKHFSQDDVKMLNEILLFFDKVVKQNCQNKSNITKCYFKYLKRIKENYSTGDLGLNISPKEQKELFNRINAESFKKIWVYNKSFSRETDTKGEILSIKNQSEYIDFLKTMSEYDNTVKGYYEPYRSVGEMNAGSVSYVVHSYQKFNLDDEKIRLILAIHYLTLNAQTNKELQTSAGARL